MADTQKTAIRTAAENRILLEIRSGRLDCGIRQILNKSEYTYERRTVERGTGEPEGSWDVEGGGFISLECHEPSQ